MNTNYESANSAVCQYSGLQDTEGKSGGKTTTHKMDQLKRPNRGRG